MAVDQNESQKRLGSAFSSHLSIFSMGLKAATGRFPPRACDFSISAANIMSDTIKQCRSTNDCDALLTAQQDWAKTIVRDYTESSTRIAEIVHKHFLNGSENKLSSL